LARCDSPPTALARLGPTPYGRSIRAGQTLARRSTQSPRRSCGICVLAGWLLPTARNRSDTGGGFEIANVDELLQRSLPPPAEFPPRQPGNRVEPSRWRIVH
jgi:hypothetical protein